MKKENNSFTRDFQIYKLDPQTEVTTCKHAVRNPQLMSLLEDELKDIYWSEKAIARNISNMIQRASSDILIKTLEAHLEEKEEHIKRVENAFELIEKEPAEKKCKAVASLIEETEAIMKTCSSGLMCDTAIILAEHKVEHYEIGIYETLHRFAENLGLDDVASILEKTLMEEIAVDKKLSEIAPHLC